MNAVHQSSVVALALFAGFASLANGSVTNGEPGARPIDALERLYRVCERASTNGTLNAEGAAYCSKVYEELTTRAFGGDFEQLEAWAKSQPASRHAGRR